MIAQTGKDTEPAPDAGEEGDDLFPEFALNIVGDIVSRKHNDINVEGVDTVNTAAQISAGDSSAVVKVADVRYAGAQQSVRKTSEGQIDLGDVDPLPSKSVNINCPTSAETQTAQCGPVKMAYLVGQFAMMQHLPDILMHNVRYCQVNITQ